MNRCRYFLFSLLILLGGCATYPDVNQERLASLPQHYSQFDVDLSWQVKTDGTQTSIDGELKNLRFEYMDDIEVWVAVLDAAGKTKAKSVSYINPHELKRGEIAPFSLRLPVPAPPGTKLRFTYKYSGTDGGEDKGQFGVQSFDSKVPGR